MRAHFETIKVIHIGERKESKMTTYGIAQRTKTSAFVRTDLPAFETVSEADAFIVCELFDFDYAMFYITPIERA